MKSGTTAYPSWITVVAAVLIGLLLLANMAVIYAFSAENGQESGERSAGVTEAVLKILYPGYEALEEAEARSVLESTHHFVRKAAHFSEFATLGLLSAALLLVLSAGIPPLRVKPWMTLAIPPVFCLLYAISDEVHQIFTGRGPRVTDVLIDFAGAVTGIVLIHIAAYLLRALMRRRREEA